MIDQTNPLPEDRYGNKILARNVLELEFADGIHPLQISGRFLQCGIHDHALVKGMKVKPTSDLVCAQLKRRWHQSFSSGPEFCGVTVNPLAKQNDTATYAMRLIIQREPLNQMRILVLAEMVDEIAKTTQAGTREIITLLEFSPELASDPRYLRGHQAANLSARDWLVAQRTQDPQLIPWLRLPNFLNPPLSLLEPKELRSALWRRIKQHCQVHGDPPRKLEGNPTWDAELARIDNLKNCLDDDQLSEIRDRHRSSDDPSDDAPPRHWSHPTITPTNNPNPHDLLQSPIAVRDLHQILLQKDGTFRCLIHQNNQRCQIDLDRINFGNFPSRDIDMAASRTLEDRLTIPPKSHLDSAWRKCPQAWPFANQLSSYCQHPLSHQELPSYIAAHLSPEVVFTWNQQNLDKASQIEAAEIFRPQREAKGLGYVAALAAPWFDRIEEELKRSLATNPNLTLQVITYQEQGWQAQDIAELLHLAELKTGVGQLELPPPPAPLPTPRREAWVDSALQLASTPTLETTFTLSL